MAHLMRRTAARCTARLPLHQQRLHEVLSLLKASGARGVLDLAVGGCCTTAARAPVRDPGGLEWSGSCWPRLLRLEPSGVARQGRVGAGGGSLCRIPAPAGWFRCRRDGRNHRACAASFPVAGREGGLRRAAPRWS
ncbi:hypothetical protein DSL92_01910 [Billgrantia gudaonensis]|uniref:Uncharacterized protein n=1 Tax=Billgrantia gudaonensis TaxID=376427 RepID=A0A432JKD3_9GAMM|nr:hypothetical protein DSL92_01910 [Halomonas gudaonensis]